MSVVPRRAGLRAVVLATLCCAAAPAVPAVAAPIPAGPPTTLPPFAGTAWTARPLTPTVAPRNPFMAANPSSNIHNDAWMTDAYDRAGPLGRSPVVTTGLMRPGLCGSLTFDRRGRIVTVCPSPRGPQARIIDPETLEVITAYDLPQAPDLPGTAAFQNFTGGGYFFLDAKDRIVTVTKLHHLITLAQNSAGTALRKVADVDLGGAVGAGDGISSALPDYAGNIWFVVKRAGTVGVVDRRTKRITTMELGEQIENSFAVDRGGVYIVSDTSMYRFGRAANGRPRVDWKVAYDDSGLVKPGQLDAGSGTTPTIMTGGYVAITDNADPMQVVVYRKAKTLKPGEKRVVCEVPVFGKGAGATENSLMTAGHALVVENNYGYQDPSGPNAAALTVPGFARVDVKADGSGCRKVWTNTTAAAPTAVPKLSTRTGLIYTYTRDDDPSEAGADPWSWTTLDVRTGRTVFTQRVGTGNAFNNNYAGVALGPDGTAYLGVLTGIVALRDGR